MSLQEQNKQSQRSTDFRENFRHLFTSFYLLASTQLQSTVERAVHSVQDLVRRAASSSDRHNDVNTREVSERELNSLSNVRNNARDVDNTVNV